MNEELDIQDYEGETVEVLYDEPEALQEPEERPGERMLLRYERMGGYVRGRVIA